ncbi:MAG: M23 family metallopeptidase [Sideroxydans sp.]|nr:M23 family metallopeptidase [Sideroxydans sp.]
MSRFLFVLLILLFTNSTCADPQLYPFKLSFRAEPGKQIVMAQNNGPAPILATVHLLNPQNAIVDTPSPIVTVVPPQASIPIASVHGAVAGKGYRVSTSFKYSIGDPDAVHDPAATYRLPFQDGQTIMIGQVIGGRITTHRAPDSRYAVDFSIPVGTPILASRKGRIVDVDQNFTRGGNDPALKANHVLILHEDGTLGMYSHFSANRINVSIGQWVEEGTLLGYSGNTGYSTGPHLHFAVLTNTRTADGTAKYISVPVTFVNETPVQKIQFTQDQQLVAHYPVQ